MFTPCQEQILGTSYVQQFLTALLTHFDHQCSTYVETRQLAFARKIFAKHLWKTDILNKEAGR